MPDTNDILQQGIAALKAGQKAEARRLLERVVQQDKDNETAWLWLSGAVDTDRECIHCLRETLRINPNNQHARRGLEKLEGKVPISRPAQSVEKKPIRPLGIQTLPAREEKKHDARRSEPIQSVEKPPDDTKQCPYCAETIKVEARFCRFCGRDLETGELPQQLRAQSEQPKIPYKAIREDRQELLTQAINRARRGCRVAHRNSRSATIIEPKRFSVVTSLVLSVTLVLAWLVFGSFGLAWAMIPLACHVLFYVCRRDKVWQVEVSEDGDVLWNGEPLAVIQKKKRYASCVTDIVLFVLLALYCAGGYYLYRYTFHK